MSFKTKIKNYDEKMILFHNAVVFYSLLTLIVLAFLTLFNIHFVKEMKEIGFIDTLCNNKIIYHTLAFLIVFLCQYSVCKVACPKVKLGQVLIYSLILNGFKYLIYYVDMQKYLNVPLDVISLIIFIKIIKGSLKKGLLMLLIISLVQLLISAIRNYWLSDILSNHISFYFIMNIDLFIIIYNIEKGGIALCGNVSYSGVSQTSYTQLEDSSLESQKSHIISLKALFPILKRQKPEEKKSAKESKKQSVKHKLQLNPYDIIYIILYLLWNAFQVWLVYCLAKSENKVFEISLLCIAFVVNKSIFGMPLHLKGDVCFIVSMIYFYICVKSLPFSSFAILLPIFAGISTALISNMIKELIEDEKVVKREGLRDQIKEKINGDITVENIYNICIDKGYTEGKAKDISDTVYNYMFHTQYETAQIVHCDNRTVTRRIKEFLKD